MRVEIKSVDDSLHAQRARGDHSMSTTRKTALRLFEASVVAVIVVSGIATLANVTPGVGPSGERRLASGIAQSFSAAASLLSQDVESLRAVPPPMPASIQLAMVENAAAGRPHRRP